MQHHPIAITGMHRSGTSMITRCLYDSGLALLGSDADRFIEAADDNPEGFWENKAIVACNDELLEAAGGAWDHPPELPPQAVDDPRVSHVAPEASAALASLRERAHWGFKDPRTCLTAPYWLDLEPDLRFIICVRHPLEVALSLKRRNQNSYSLGLALWERYYATVLASLPAEHRIVTHFDTFFADPRGELRRLCEFAGLEPAEPQVRSDLRHHTIGVSLREAGASPTLQALYRELCAASNTPLPPDRPVDEGRVRRRILDGAVAERHAEQRQAAIVRLQEREEELRRDKAAVENDLRARIRSLELSVATAGPKAAQAQTMEAIRTLSEGVARTEQAVRSLPSRGRIRRAVDRSERRAASGAKKLAVVPARRVLRVARSGPRSVAAAAVRRLPAPARSAVGGTRRALSAGERTARPAAVAVVRRLPPGAREVVRRTQRVAGQRGPAALPRAAIRRLPPSAQATLRRGRRLVQRVDGASRASRPLSRVAQLPAQARGATPKRWMGAYTSLVASSVPNGEPWLVVTPGSPREVRSARSPKGTAFPVAGARSFTSDLSFIAQLEGMRYQAHRHLVVPEGSRAWLRERTELRSHVTGRYRTVTDRPQAGSVFDLARPAEPGSRSLRAELDEVATGMADAPAVLDWTAEGIADEVPGVTTFRAGDGERLPYLDESVDIVVLDTGRDQDEAARVASRCVITVEQGPSGTVEVRAVRARSDPRTSVASRVLVWTADPGGDERWRELIADCAAVAGASLHVGAIGADGPDAGDADVLLVVEPHVLPLPGSVQAAAALALADKTAAVAGRVLDTSGHLEAAGGTVFADRSVGLIGAGSADVRAPWHDYSRPVCWAPGLVAMAAALWEDVPRPRGAAGRAFVREWCSAAWADGRSVVYQPSVTAVRLTGDGGEPTTPLSETAWQRVLDLRPRRPADLSDGAWRYLLGHDDVEACRG